MGEHDGVQARDAQLRERGDHDPRTDVQARRREAAQIAASVDEDRGASRKLHERGVALTDREKGDAKAPREAGRGGVRESGAEQGAGGKQRPAQPRPGRWPARARSGSQGPGPAREQQGARPPEQSGPGRRSGHD